MKENILSKFRDVINYSVIFKVIGILIIIFLCILIYKEIKPKTASEKIMNCLKLGSDARATACIKLIK